MSSISIHYAYIQVSNTYLIDKILRAKAQRQTKEARPSIFPFPRMNLQKKLDGEKMG